MIVRLHAAQIWEMIGVEFEVALVGVVLMAVSVVSVVAPLVVQELVVMCCFEEPRVLPAPGRLWEAAAVSHSPSPS